MTLGRPNCGTWEEAIRYEWLVANNLGGFACGTVAGANTRRYHGFLLASFKPPVERTLLVAKVDLTAEYLGRQYALSANEFADGTVSAQGFMHIETFAVVDGIPTWRYAIGGMLLQQQVFMAPLQNSSYLRLEILRGTDALKLALKPLVTYRDYHAQGRGPRPFKAIANGAGCRIDAGEGARPFTLSLSRGRYEPADEWCWNVLHREERARGLDDLEDLWMPGVFRTDLEAGQPAYFTATAEPAVAFSAAESVYAALSKSAQDLQAALPASAPRWIRRLARASDQFIVRRGHDQGADFSLVAGYPWFADWGRDTMIALPGLTTALGRHDVAAGILRSYAGYVNRGMLPNRFPDSGDTPEYNTADATLWLFRALDEALSARPEPALVTALFPALEQIIRAHVDGTRFGIRVDPRDGLLASGLPGSQLTWMDAKVGDHAFTPRVGKAVEINALWLNALEFMTRLAGQAHGPAAATFYRQLLAHGAANFGRFWNGERRCLYDVIDVAGGTGRNASIRPNQLFAVALPYSVLEPDQKRAVVDLCTQELLTSYGLRSLSPADPEYRGRYAGGPAARDAAYHQGTVWAWLLGPFACAHYRVYGDRTLAQSFLAPMAQHLDAACVGSISEIFDGDPPHAACGCFAQAWSVAEILRAWLWLERALPGRAENTQ